MFLNLEFTSIEDETPWLKGQDWVPCLCYTNKNRIEFGVWNKFKKTFWSPQYKQALCGVTHFHICNYGDKESNIVEEMQNDIESAYERIRWALSESSDEGYISYDGRGYLISARDYLAKYN